MSSHDHRQQKSLRVAKTSESFTTKVYQLYLMRLLWNKEPRRETVKLLGLSSLSFFSVLWGHLLLDHWSQKQTKDLNKQRTNSVRWCDGEVIYCLSNKNKHALMIMNKQLLSTKGQFINMYPVIGSNSQFSSELQWRWDGRCAPFRNRARARSRWGFHFSKESFIWCNLFNCVFMICCLRDLF